MAVVMLAAAAFCRVQAANNCIIERTPRPTMIVARLASMRVKPRRRRVGLFLRHPMGVICNSDVAASNASSTQSRGGAEINEWSKSAGQTKSPGMNAGAWKVSIGYEGRGAYL